MSTIRLKFPDSQIFFYTMYSIFLSCKEACCPLCTLDNKVTLHMFNGKVNIRKESDNMVVMTRIEYGTSDHTHSVAYFSHHESGIIPYSLLWHAIFGHINYDNLCLLRKNGVFGLPTIPRKLKQCDACTLGKHRKQPFHDSTSRACRILELIHSYFCGPMFVPSTNGNKYIMIFIDNYTRMFWVYLTKEKSQDFELLKSFMYEFKMKLSIILDLFTLIMEEHIHLMNLKDTFSNMGSNIKPQFHTIPNRMVWLNK
jgi:hypothetical protein